MSPDPITPTRIIPAGQTAALPDRPPAPGERPPWWEQTPRPGPPTALTAPPASPPASPPPPPPHREAPQPAPPPGAVEVHIRYQPHEAPRRRWTWTWLTDRLHPWWSLTGAVAVLTPIPWTGYSLATTWAYCVGEIRAEHGYGWGYATACGALTAACLYDHRGKHWRVITRATAVVALVGVLGAIHWYDPVTLITGVHPS